MTTTLAELKAEMLKDPQVAAEHERLRELLEAAVARDFRSYSLGKWMAQRQRRAWRAETRTTKPLSGKVKFAGVKVDVVPPPKKGRGK